MNSSKHLTKYQERLQLIRKIRDIASTADNLNVPQICVVGDQSAGKSSFLSRLTSVSFPTAAKMCTKVATVVTCVHDASLSSTVFEIEDWTQPGSYDEIEGTASAISSTQKAMLDDMDEGSGEDSNLIVSDHEVKLTVRGPDVIDIIIVDLPGIQHTGPMQDQISNLIKKYISKQETLICVVSEAKQDDELCKAMEFAVKHDPKKERTIRILSKFDNFDSYDTKKRAISNVQKDIFGVHGGPHAILSVQTSNGDPLTYGEEGEIQESKSLENDFSLPKHRAGIASLKERLPPIFENLIDITLPSLKQRVIDILTNTNRELDEVGREEVSGRDMVEKCRSVLFRQKTKIEKQLTRAHTTFKEEIHATGDLITFEFSTESFVANSFECVFFQGNTEFEEAISRIRKLWEPILFRYLEKVIEITTQSVIEVLLEDRNVKLFEHLNRVIHDEFQKHFQQNVIPKFKQSCEDRLFKEDFFGTVNHYLEAKYQEEVICPEDFVSMFESKLRNQCKDNIKEDSEEEYDDDVITVEMVMHCLKKAKKEIGDKVRQEDLQEAQKRKLHAAVKANFAVEKKTFTDNILKETRVGILDERSQWFQSGFLHSNELIEAAQEDKHLAETRQRLKDKIDRLTNCLEELKDVPLPTSGAFSGGLKPATGIIPQMPHFSFGGASTKPSASSGTARASGFVFGAKCDVNTAKVSTSTKPSASSGTAPASGLSFGASDGNTAKVSTSTKPSASSGTAPASVFGGALGQTGFGASSHKKTVKVSTSTNRLGHIS